MAQTTHRLSVNIGDGNTNSGNITGSFNNIVYSSDEASKIMHWLSPLEPNNRHQSVRNERFDSVGDWLLETAEFREWKGGEGGADRAVLFCSGNPGVGKTYLRDVNPNQVDAECGRTPLAWAARNGYLGVVKILLERGDVNPNQADTYYGRTPLSFAAECGYEVMVKMLLERGDVNPEQVDAEYIEK